jgi:hypothetical protein
MNRRSQVITVDQLPGPSCSDEPDALGSPIHPEQTFNLLFECAVARPAGIDFDQAAEPAVSWMQRENLDRQIGLSRLRANAFTRQPISLSPA